MASKKLMELLNRGIARELQVFIQYMWQHVLATGVESVAVEDIFREIAITEMKHAEVIAERLAYLGGTPTIKPDPIFVGGSLKEMLQGDVKAEKIHASLYQKAKQAVDGGEDVDLGPIQICQVCGYTVEGDAPDRCLLCKARKERFKTF